MIYQNLVIDFIKRTKENLSFIEEQAEKNETPVYEVTQLINSMLGLLVFPHERFRGGIPPIPLQELEAKGWLVPHVEGEFPQVENLLELIRYLRNAVAHTNLEFISDGHSLTGVRLWNLDRKGEKTWQVRMTTAELRSLVLNFADLLLQKNL